MALWPRPKRCLRSIWFFLSRGAAGAPFRKEWWACRVLSAALLVGTISNFFNFQKQFRGRLFFFLLSFLLLFFSTSAELGEGASLFFLLANIIGSCADQAPLSTPEGFPPAA